MPDLKTRSRLPEKMDDLAVPESEVRTAIGKIEQINKWLGGNKVTLRALEKLRWPEGTVTIMDLGCGRGDMLRRIAIWAQKKRRDVRLIGVDINPAMTRLAGNKSLLYPGLSFTTADVFDDALLCEKPQFVICSLFTHHFDQEDLKSLLLRMYLLAGKAVIINDIHRHWLAYYSIRILTRLFFRDRMVRYDAPLSVARSLTRREWQQTMEEAGLRHYTIRWRWAWRWEIIIEK